MNTTTKIALLGMGGRGQSLMEYAVLPACQDMNSEIIALFDPYEDRTNEGADIVKRITGKRPIAAKSADEIFANPEVQAVIIASSWESHVDLAIKAMRAGKYVAFEVGGAYSLEECWRLVETSEQTGVPCMMLENCCYGQRELMITNMVRQGIMGDIVHCSGGYHHDLRDQVARGKEIRHYRLRNYIHRNCENYPTHELGPIAKLLNINNGNRMMSLTSMSSCAKGLHQFIVSNWGEEHPYAHTEFAQGDVVTTSIKCAKGQTIVISLDTTLPRGYSRAFTVRGTKGAYFEDTDCIFLDKEHHDFEWEPKKIWDNAKDYEEKYQHPLWQGYDPHEGQDNHGGMDYLVVCAFLEAVQKGTRTPIDVYDTAAWMCITALSEESIQRGGAPVSIPDFTRGKWYMRQDIDYTLKYNLDQDDPSRDIH
jgi:hypothetical protein